MPLVLVTGFPGVGKTTVVRAVALALAKKRERQSSGAGARVAVSGASNPAGDDDDGRGADGTCSFRQVAGFFTEELREEGTRVGFDVVDLSTNARAALARVSETRRRGRGGGARVGKYTVDVASFGALAMNALSGPPAAVYIIDEIGKMELFCDEFVAAARAVCVHAAADNCFAVVTVAVKGGGLIADVKRIPGARVVEVTEHNRGELPNSLTEEVLTWRDAHPYAPTPPAWAAERPVRARSRVVGGGGGGKTVMSSLCLIPDASLWPAIQSIREKHDKHIVRWPPHINILYPFVPVEDFDDTAAKLSRVLADFAPFEVRNHRTLDHSLARSQQHRNFAD
jgi:nucleoside-triphosphatase THEP1